MHCVVLRWESVWICDCFAGQQAVAVHGSVSRGLLTLPLAVLPEIVVHDKLQQLLIFHWKACCLTFGSLALDGWVVTFGTLSRMPTYWGLSCYAKHNKTATSHSALVVASGACRDCTTCLHCNSAKETSEHLMSNSQPGSAGHMTQSSDLEWLKLSVELPGEDGSGHPFSLTENGRERKREIA